MTKATNLNRRIQLLSAVIATIVFLFISTLQAAAQNESQFKVGDRVEADINMSSSPEYQNWREATIVEIMMWQGMVSGIRIKTDDGRDITTSARHLRKLSEAEKKIVEKNQTNTPHKTRNNPSENEEGDEQEQAEFKVGDRVEVDSIMASDPKDSRWKKATVKAVDLENRRYVVMLDDFNEMSVLIRPGKVWIRPLKDGSRAPEYATCEFYKNYKKVSHAAPPSAELFKSVIFEWFNSINRYQDFGLVFVDFKMGSPFKNRARGNGRKDIDPAPIGATIYPLKTKLILCEKDLNLTFRTEWVNEYSCYKSQFGEWVCKNAAPQNYKRTSFPNK